MNNIKKMVCQTCGATENVFMNFEASGDDEGYKVDNKGVITHWDGDAPVNLDGLSNINFMFSNCIDGCEDETFLDVYFEDGKVLEDEEAFDYFIAEK